MEANKYGRLGFFAYFMMYSRIFHISWEYVWSFYEELEQMLVKKPITHTWAQILNFQ